MVFTGWTLSSQLRMSVFFIVLLPSLEPCNIFLFIIKGLCDKGSCDVGYNVRAFCIDQ